MNHKDLSVFELCDNLNLPVFKVRQLCHHLHIHPVVKSIPGKRIKTLKGMLKAPEEVTPVRQHFDKNNIPYQKERTPIPRPPASYTNIPTPYGIATEMLWQQLEEEKKEAGKQTSRKQRKKLPL